MVSITEVRNQADEDVTSETDDYFMETIDHSNMYVNRLLYYGNSYQEVFIYHKGSIKSITVTVSQTSSEWATLNAELYKGNAEDAITSTCATTCDYILKPKLNEEDTLEGATCTECGI